MPQKYLDYANTKLGSTLTASNVITIVNEAQTIANTYKGIPNLSSISGTLNGHTVSIATTNGTPFVNLKSAIQGVNLNTTTINAAPFLGSGGEVVLKVDGRVLFQGNSANVAMVKNLLTTATGTPTPTTVNTSPTPTTVNTSPTPTTVNTSPTPTTEVATNTLDKAVLIDFVRAVGILPAVNMGVSTTLATTSPSSTTSQIVYDALDSTLLSHQELADRAALPQDGLKVGMAGLTYDSAKFIDSKDNGDIKSAVLSLSTNISGYELGAYIPYEYINFDSFSGHKAGTVLYGKKYWNLPSHLHLSTMANFNYVATYIDKFSLTNTFGGGAGLNLTYDDLGDFVSKINFVFQYNQDDYFRAHRTFQDNHQYLIKAGAGLGYRLFDNATLQTGFNYTRDLTSYKSGYNQLQDKDYFDFKVGASYTVANNLQINVNYRRMIGLENYNSNSVMIGATLGF